jgi:hypothetical protein
MPHSTTLRTTILDEVYVEVVERTAAALAMVAGRKTVGIDGKTDARGRGTLNITEAKQGVTLGW